MRVQSTQQVDDGHVAPSLSPQGLPGLDAAEQSFDAAVVVLAPLSKVASVPVVIDGPVPAGDYGSEWPAAQALVQYGVLPAIADGMAPSVLDATGSDWAPQPQTSSSSVGTIQADASAAAAGSMYTYNFVWYSGATTAIVIDAGQSILLDVFEDLTTPENDVVFRLRNVIVNDYDSSSIVNLFADTGTSDTVLAPLFSDLSIGGLSAGIAMQEPGNLDGANLTPADAAFMQFPGLAMTPDFSAGRQSSSVNNWLGISTGEHLSLRGVLGEGKQFSDVIDLMSIGMNDSYNDANRLDQLTPAERATYQAGASQGLRISLLLHNVVPDAVEVNNHGLFVTDGVVAVSATPGSGALDDVLEGTASNDVLDGGIGADRLSGLAGDDLYVVDSFDDRVLESAGEGIDTIESYVSLILPSNVENLRLHAISGAGNSLDNLIVAGSGNNYIDGMGGIDTLSYQGAGGSVVVSLSNSGKQSTGGSGVDQVLNFENLVGSSFGDSLTGSIGANLIDGGAGADTMNGKEGNDTYVVDNAGDLISDVSGVDTVRSWVSFTLDSKLENLLLLGVDAIDGTGSALNNELTGNAGSNILRGLNGNDRLDGGGSADTLIGGAGNDIYMLDDADDTIIELVNEGTDTIFSSVSRTLGDNLENLTLTGTLGANGSGNPLNNVLTGNDAVNTLSGLAGNDTFFGGGGADTLVGGPGNDSYMLDGLDDTLVELANEGTDTVNVGVNYALPSQFENLVLTGTAAVNGTGNTSNNVLTGNGASNTLTGLDGNDNLDGRSGADTMIGGPGNDVYIVDQAGDIVVETSGQGTDTVIAAISYTLADVLENLTLSGTASTDGTGNASNNALIGNSGANTLRGLEGTDSLDGRVGADAMIGGIGNDSYVVDNVGDLVVENAGEGTDSVSAAISYALGENVENLSLSGTGANSATGNSAANTLTGSSSANTINGAGGNDLLIGGNGADTLIGGTGSDRFDFNALLESPVGAGRDRVMDFSAAEFDKIDLSTIDSNTVLAGNQAFSFIDTSAFSGAGQLRFDQGLVQGDVNGDGIADFSIELVGVASLMASDFIL